MKRILTAICIVMTSMALNAQDLTILHMNDTHSHMDPERSGKHAGKGGVIEQALYIDEVMKIIERFQVWDSIPQKYADWEGQTIVYDKSSMPYKREFLADATSVEFTRNPKGLISALRKLDSDTSSMSHISKATAHMYINDPSSKTRIKKKKRQTH